MGCGASKSPERYERKLEAELNRASRTSARDSMRRASAAARATDAMERRRSSINHMREMTEGSLSSQRPSLIIAPTGHSGGLTVSECPSGAWLRIASFSFKPPPYESGTLLGPVGFISELEAKLCDLDGLLEYQSMWLDNGLTYSFALSMSTEAAMHAYTKAVQRDFMPKLEPYLAGPPAYQDVGGLTCKHVTPRYRGRAAPAGCVLRLSSFRVPPKQEHALLSIFQELEEDIVAGVDGLLSYSAMWNADARSYSYAMTMTSAAAVEEYAATVAAKFLPRLQPLLGGPPLYLQEGELAVRMANDAAR